MKTVTTIALLLGSLISPLYAGTIPIASGTLLPVATARAGFTPSQVRDIREKYSYQQVISAGDVSLFHFLNLGVWLPTTIVSRQGNVIELETTIEPRVGFTRVSNVGDVTTLNGYLNAASSRAQGMIVLHKGHIIFEEYPGMRPSDSHVWMSIAKTTTSLIVHMLADEGKIDVQKPIDDYISALRTTEWAGTRVIDVLDMTSGMDIIETQANREDPRSVITRYNLAVSGEPNFDGKKENQFDVIRSAKRIGPAGKSFDYSSMNTTLLALLAETVENKRWNDIFQERIWSKMSVEGDLQVALSPDNTPQAHGLIASRLRDLARYGLLYTPSWQKAAREKIISTDYIREIQTGGRKAIFLEGELGNRLTSTSFWNSPPSTNNWQWDAVWHDGDFFKGGVYGQGLYISPKKDLVIAWFSTAMSSDLTLYARQIAMNTPVLH